MLPINIDVKAVVESVVACLKKDYKDYGYFYNDGTSISLETEAGQQFDDFAVFYDLQNELKVVIDFGKGKESEKSFSACDDDAFDVSTYICDELDAHFGAL